MTEHPFEIFRPYADRIRVRLYERRDNICNDEDIERAEKLPVANPEQPHGTLTMRVYGPGHVPGADGVVTDTPRIALCARGADCQMFVFYDPVHHAGGTLHAGWRSLVAGALPACIEVMKREWGTNPHDLIVGAGPSLCFDCGEFTDPVKELSGVDEKFFRARLADLCSIATDQLHKAGVPLNNVERHRDCTRCDREHWWTLRGGDRDALATGVRNLLTFSLL